MDKSSQRWDVGHEKTPTVVFDGDTANISELRDFRYECNGGHEANWRQRTVNLAETTSVDFIVVPFSKDSSLAHTMVSFGFANGSHLAISVEARRRKGQPYSIWKGQFGAFPLMYVIADERDCIGHRVDCYDYDVHLYRSAATPEESRTFLTAMLRRANALTESSEKYNTLFNNCLTNLRSHVNSIWPRRIPWGWGVLFTGHADHLAYNLGILNSNDSFRSLHDQANISPLAKGNGHRDDYSCWIRSGLPPEAQCLH